VITAATALLAVAAGALPASPGIAFTYADGIQLMRADGSGVVGLTDPPGQAEDGQPAWSPDGSRLAFVRVIEGNEEIGTRSEIHLLDEAGERPLTDSLGAIAFDPAWSPDGRQIAFARQLGEDQRDATEIVVVPVDGGPERVLRRQRQGMRWMGVGQPGWSPDGARIVYTRTRLDRSYDFRNSLFVIDAAGGTPRLFAREASDAAWSPDGSRIAFSSGRDRNGKWCGSDECFYNDELYVMDADGTDPVRLTRNHGDDSSPTWSPDGRYIAFSSDRNVHDPGGFDTEIYAIRADGSCLNWLTNGAPRSSEPAWRASSAPFVPPACGPTPRPPRTEVIEDRIRAEPGDPAVWLGERHGSLLLSTFQISSDRRGNGSYFFRYDDCARFRMTECPRGLQLQVFSVCSPQSRLAGFDRLSTVPPGRHFVRGGVLYVDVGFARASVIAGSASVTIYAEAGPGRPGAGLLRAGAALRPFTRKARPLPPPGLPATLLRRLDRTERAHRQAGGVDGAALALHVKPEVVRRRLRLGRAVNSLPRVRAISCGRH
jgi:Tol biopolymer transport system component